MLIKLLHVFLTFRTNSLLNIVNYPGAINNTISHVSLKLVRYCLQNVINIDKSLGMLTAQFHYYIPDKLRCLFNFRDFVTTLLALSLFQGHLRQEIVALEDD